MRKELRIGNLIDVFINTTNGKLYSRGFITALHKNTVEIDNKYTSQYNMIEPISLDNDKLIKIGFEKYNYCFYKIKINGKIIDGWYLSNNNELTKSIGEFFIRIKSINELQNTIYYLTKTELTINL